MSDKQRDRRLQLLGYEVLRYAGSEIWADQIMVARDVVDHLNKLREFPQQRRNGRAGR